MLIGLVAQAKQGKSTAANHLTGVHGFTLVKFAGPLKDMLYSIGLCWEEIEGKDKEAPSPLLCGKTPRFAMQTLGTEWGRQTLGEDFWVNLWAHRARKELVAERHVVVDDCRFENEARAVLRLGGVLVRLSRPGGPVIPVNHASEIELVRIVEDLHIENDGTIEQLCDTLDGLVQHLRLSSAREQTLTERMR